MEQYYHGARRRGPYFEGWYFKLQSKGGEALAVIPALHIDAAGRRSASLQIITGSESWWLEYPEGEFAARENRLQIRMGQNVFSDQGVWLDAEGEGLSLHGTLRCGPLSPPKSDIMGPFRFFSGMQCAHGVISMAHPMEGTLRLNGRIMDFGGGMGYIETDRGRSFPSAYLWTQCGWRESQRNSLMLAIATIPLPMGSFTGCICAVLYGGQEYRLATYRGTQIEGWSDRGAAIRQGRYRLEVELLAGRGHPLRAPAKGKMKRIVHESLCAKVCYRFWCGKRLLFEHTDDYASFEFSDERAHRSGPDGKPL